MNTNTEINIYEQLPHFKSIDLESIEKASLMRRRDSKYVYPVTRIPEILARLTDHYYILEIEHLRSHPYNTLYYDTRDMEMYHMHHRGLSFRQKIRFRTYEVSDTVFLEVKEKNNKGITVKKRIRSNGNKGIILSKEEEFLASATPYQHHEIVPVLENTFNRITLVEKNQKERITIDYNLCFMSPDRKQIIDLPGLSIAELKREGNLSASEFNTVLRQNGIYPMRFSKYCIGIAMLNPDIPQNRFKAKILKIKKINLDYETVQT
ncbi:MAG: polyphosphate polymerase domain-containing protein [Bacteroidales bacterium]|nr:polyphosphate polymerase domain-containing protein [Bacteroidales bacterium]